MLHPDSTSIRLIHRQMIETELARHRRPDRDDPERPRRRPMLALRRVTARMLRAIACWIEPVGKRPTMPERRAA